MHEFLDDVCHKPHVNPEKRKMWDIKPDGMKKIKENLQINLNNC